MTWFGVYISYYCHLDMKKAINEEVKKKRKEITQERESWIGGITLGWKASNPMYVALVSISKKKTKNKIQPPWSGINL